MLTIEPGAGGTVLIAGRFDAAQCATVRGYLDKLDGIVTLDCGGLEYISSAGLGVLLKTQKRLMAAGGKLRLTGV
ncbi:MAG TPA: STAS domain-containing protein, partial [Burkholderiales bacterium]|nr:STAS domain-containing protein [Burkholderiales bacterium]